MEKFVPYEKLSKKERRRLDARKRGSWGGLSPVTRKSVNPKAYNRRTAQRWENDPRFEPLFASPRGRSNKRDHFLEKERCG